MDCMEGLWIIQTFSELSRQFLDFRTVFGLSGQFLDHLDSFLYSLDSFWIVETVSGLSEHFLDVQGSFWIVRTFF